MAIETWNDAYTSFYEARKHIQKVYPNEFLIRTMLGTYPKLGLDKSSYAGSKILDIGFGDGRNFQLLHDLDFHIHGTEITEGICALARERMSRMNIPATLKVGRNNSIPFADNEFDYLLASSSCYYVDPGTTFRDNLAEFSRVLKPGGVFILTLPKTESFIFENSTALNDGHVLINNDPYNIRNGYVLRRFQDCDEIESTFGDAFTDFSFGSCDDDFFGVRVSLWLIVCKRKT